MKIARPASANPRRVRKVCSRLCSKAGGVDHGELVDELHRVLESRVESEAAGADDEVAHKGEQEDALMVLLQAVADAAVCEVDEEQVGEGVYDLGGVSGRVVVLLAPV
jgi:hypothetical protein